MAFNKSIKDLRENNSLTQMDFAKRIGVKTGIIAEWESGESEPTMEQLAKISAEFGVSLDDLIGVGLKGETKLNEDNSNKASQFNNELNKNDYSYKAQDEPEKKKSKSTVLIVVSIIVVLSLLAGGIGLFLFRKVSFSDDTNAISKAETSVVKVYCYDYYGKESCTGSGFIAFDSQTVVTNYHVACEGYAIKVSTSDEVIFDVESIVAYNENQDIAVLKLTKDTNIKPVVFGNPDELKKGEKVTVIGSPQGIKNSVSTGDFSGRIPSKEYDILQFTASISPGSSGGALFNDVGEVVGVTYGSYKEGQNLNLAIPINVVNDVYSNKAMPTKTDVIYSRKYPYVSYLIGAEETTISEINKDITKEVEKGIIKSVYISSYDGLTLDKSETVYIVEDKTLISGDFNFDTNNNNASMLELKCGGGIESLSYCSEGLKIGSCVTVLINHGYLEMGKKTRINYTNCYAIIDNNKF